MTRATYTEAEDAALDAAEALHDATCDGTCEPCMLDAEEAEMDRRFEAAREDRLVFGR